MPRPDFEIRIVHDGLADLPAAARRRAARTVRKNALQIEAQARLNTERVDTGSMRAGWFTVTDNSSDYADAAGEAERLNPSARLFDPPEQQQPLSAMVANAVDHTIFNELGTVNGPAAPMLEPAVEMQRPTFEREISADLAAAAAEVSKR
jgi:hypothetical protein